MDTNTSSHQTVEVLKKHVNSIVSSIQSIKQKNVDLESQVATLEKENKTLQEQANQHLAKNKTYEEKLHTLQQLLDEAQDEQGLLEQSILSAISNLSDASKEISGAGSVQTASSPSQSSSDEIRIDSVPDHEILADEGHEADELDEHIIVDDELANIEDEQLEIF